MSRELDQQFVEAAANGHRDAVRVLIRAGARASDAWRLVPHGDPAGTSLLLDRGCIAEQDAEQLRAAILADTSERFGPLGQRQLLQRLAEKAPSPALEVP